MENIDDGTIVGVARDQKHVLIRFNKKEWLGMTPDQAIEFATLILHHANELKQIKASS